jgi:hypothetical protein
MIERKKEREKSRYKSRPERNTWKGYRIYIKGRRNNGNKKKNTERKVELGEPGRMKDCSLCLTYSYFPTLERCNFIC